MEYRCVIDKNKKYVDFVQYIDDVVQHYKLKDDESLVDALPPIKKINAASDGFIIPMWKENAWAEGATAEQIAQWEKEHPVDLENIKESRIAQSKTDLQTYLVNHPLQWTDGKYYTITAEKQQQLTSKLLSATFAQQAEQPYNLTWNDTQQVCEPWTLENLTALAFAIDARVTALVTYQQEKEKQMRNAETLKVLESIVVNYDEVV